MTKDPGKRQRGQGVIGADPVIINNSWDKGANELFLLYKTQSPTGQGTIRMVRLNAGDGFSVLGVSHQLVAAVPTRPSRTYLFRNTVEAPSLLVLRNGWFVLFTAHGAFDKCTYSTQWYASRHPWSWPGGPTTLLSQSSTRLCAPGTGDISPGAARGQYRFFFNAYPGGDPHSTRALYADALTLGSNGHTPRPSGGARTVIQLGSQARAPRQSRGPPGLFPVTSRTYCGAARTPEARR